MPIDYIILILKLCAQYNKTFFVCGHRQKIKELPELLFSFFSICLISSLKEIQMKKNRPGQELNRGLLALQRSTLATELQQLCYRYNGKLSRSVKNFKNQAADLAPVLAKVLV